MQLSRIGPFALEQSLDESGASPVYLGIHVEQRRPAAVKLLPVESVAGPMGSAMFRQEVAALQQLTHPRIVRCYGGSIEQGQPYLAFELIRGESLRSRLARRGRLSWEPSVDICRALCAPLAFAHQKGIYHERLTPEKVLISTSGELKITGFASAWTTRYDQNSPSGIPISIAHYLAPEQLSGRQAASGQSDVFSLGVMLFEMLAGQLPWNAATTPELVAAREAHAAPRVTTIELNCPVWLDVLVSKLLCADPEERFPDVAQVEVALEEAKRKVASGIGTAEQALAFGGSPLTVRGDQQELQRIRETKHRKSRGDTPIHERTWFLALCLLALLSAAGWLLWPASEEELFRNAQVLMASDNTADWRRARDHYLLELRDRFPDGKYRSQVDAFFDQIEMDQAEARMRNNTRLGRPPSGEGERLYADAWRYEQFGDRVAALDKYDALVNLLADSEHDTDAPYVKLARRRREQILARSTLDESESRIQFVERHLDRADELFENGRRLAAQKIWDSVVALYDGNRELKPQVQRARQARADADDSRAP